jgi:hypothetical protein
VVAELGEQGTAWGITTDLADRAQIEAFREQLASRHGDAILLVDGRPQPAPVPIVVQCRLDMSVTA